jgi:hypothetical protein
MGQHTTGPEQHDCSDCGKPIGNAPRVTMTGGKGTKVVCVPCHQKYVTFRHSND